MSYFKITDLMRSPVYIWVTLDSSPHLLSRMLLTKLPLLLPVSKR